MKLVIQILFLIVVVYHIFRFVQLLIVMNQKAIIPATDSEKNALRIFPQKALSSPTYSSQKWRIIIYSFMLLFMNAMFFIGFDLNWSYHLILMLPLVNSRNTFNLVAVVEDGLLCGDRFIAWEKIKTFQVEPIDSNHRYYGFEKEVNGGYEFRIKTGGGWKSFIVLTEEMNEKLTTLLNEKSSLNGPA